MSQGQNVTVDILIGSKCYCGRSELGRFVQASLAVYQMNQWLKNGPVNFRFLSKTMERTQRIVTYADEAAKLEIRI